MPTGYTAAVHDGKVTDFYTFAWTAARGMGAFVCARDDVNPAREPTPEELDDLCDTGVERYRTSLAESLQQLTELEARSDEQWHEARLESERSEAAEDKARREENAVFLDRYRAMLAQVNAWTPPTCDHVEFQTFMRDQLVISMRSYCGTSEARPPRTDAEFKDDELTRARRSFRFYAEQLEAAASRAAERRAWILALAASLKSCSGRDLKGPRTPHDKYAGKPAHSAAGWNPDDDGHG